MKLNDIFTLWNQVPKPAQKEITNRVYDLIDNYCNNEGDDYDYE